MGVQQLENQDQRPHTLSPDQPGTPASGYYGDRAQSSPSSTRRSRLANRAPEPLIQESYECPPNPKVWAPPTPMSPYQRFENTFNSSYWSQNRQIWTPTRRAYETRLDKITVDTYLPQPHLDKGYGPLCPSTPYSEPLPICAPYERSQELSLRSFQSGFDKVLLVVPPVKRGRHTLKSRARNQKGKLRAQSLPKMGSQNRKERTDLYTPPPEKIYFTGPEPCFHLSNTRRERPVSRCPVFAGRDPLVAPATPITKLGYNFIPGPGSAAKAKQQAQARPATTA